MIKTKNLTKKFGDETAVEKINLDVRKGEVFGLLGPNGAGKTTLVSMLTTLLNPTKGTAKINGFDIIKQPDKVRDNIGLVFQDNVCDKDLTIYQNLDISGRLYNIDKATKEKRIKELLKLLDLYKHKEKIVENLSGGMKRKLEIARGIIHKPKLLFLDEPTIGLDPRMRRKIWNYIDKLKQNSTIILATHYLTEAEQLCDRIGIMNKARLVKIGKPKNLKKILKKKEIGKNITLYDVFLEHTK